MATRLKDEFEKLTKMNDDELFLRKKVKPKKPAQQPKVAKIAVKSGKPLNYEE